MRKVIVFQHVAHQILGTLNPILKKSGLNIRYINFERTPHATPTLDKYHGLVVLGGHMGVYESYIYRHINVELKLIEEALKKNIPILGICLGSQLLAQVLGSSVRKNHEMEIGWYDIHLTEAGLKDPLLNSFQSTEKIFELHGDTFDIPQCATHLAYSHLCPAQAFRYGDMAYGIQFHLEVDRPMIERWLKHPKNQRDIFAMKDKTSSEKILLETDQYLERSLHLSQNTFLNFVKLFSFEKKGILLGSGH